MTQIYDQAQLGELLRRGGAVDKDGLYSFWLWAPQGSQAILRVKGQAFEPTHAGAPAPWHSWVRAGQVALKLGQEFPLELRMNQLQGGEAISCFLALSAENNFDPRRSFEVTRVFQRAGVNQPGHATVDRFKGRGGGRGDS